MKRRFSKILGVGLTLALITSLLLVTAPVSALTQPAVSVDDPTISVTTDYSIVTALGVRLGGTSTLSFSALSDRVVTVTAGAPNAILTWPALTTVTTGGTSGAVIASGASITFTGAGVTQAAETVVLTLTDGAVSNISSGGGSVGTATVSDAALPTDSIIIEFDEDIDITGVAAADVTVAATSGIGTPAWGPTTIDIVTGDVVDQELTIDVPLAIGVGAMIEVVVSGVDNPDVAGYYTLDVSTTNEDAKTSSVFEIEVPDIGVLPGIVQVFNPTDVLMNQFTGDTAIVSAIGVAQEDYTIVVGPGEYNSATITINQEGLTLKSSAGAVGTIIDAVSGDAIVVSAADVTVDDFTIEPSSGSKGISVTATGTDATVINNIMTDTTETGYPEGIRIAADGATVSGNALDIYNTMMVMGATNSTLSDNTFGAGINVDGSTGIDIIDNDLTGAELVGIRFGGSDCTDILIEGNTIAEVTASATTGDAGIGFIGTFTVTNLQIIGNDITDNEGDGIVIPSTVTLTNSVIKFNTITGNDSDTGDYGIQNYNTSVPVDATFNWWGTDVAADVAAMVKGVTGGAVAYEPFLVDTAEAVVVDGKFATEKSSLDAKDETGVRVSGMEDTTGGAGHNADIIAAFKYLANPQEAISDAIGFYDVYVVLNAGTTVSQVEATLKFYDNAITGGSTVYFWTGDFWALCSDQDVRTGLIWVTVDEDTAPALDELEGTPFVVVAGEAVVGLTEPVITVPVSGDDTVSLTPIFAWDAVAAADGYYFQLADNANFVAPLVKLDGDLGRLIVTAYAYVTELPYSTAYYWRVKAVSGTEAAGDLAESAWSTGVFITMVEPEEPTPPVVIEDVPTPVITIEQPDITIEIPEIVVPLPDVVETPITPTWIYVIIAVGAVLVIALLVLIVRTRRVA